MWGAVLPQLQPLTPRNCAARFRKGFFVIFFSSKQALGKELNDCYAGLVRLQGQKSDQNLNLMEFEELMEDVIEMTTPIDSGPAHLNALL